MVKILSMTSTFAKWKPICIQRPQNRFGLKYVISLDSMQKVKKN